jgi:hypothetical protein
MAHRVKSTWLVVVLALAGLGVTLVLARGPATPPAGGEMTPAAGTSAKVGPSGAPVPGRVRGWTRVFADGFNKRVVRGHWPRAVRRKWGRWSYPNGWPDTHHIGTYYPSRVVSQHNSLLDLYIHTEHGVHMVAAPVPTIPHAQGRAGGLRYGRYAVRFKADPLRCYKTAWLLWPDSGVWPRDGEIDFPEGDLTGHISGFVHHKGASSSSDQNAFNWNARYTSWHTAILAWTPSRVNMYLDGVKRSTTRRVPSKPMHWVLQTEANCNPRPSTAGHVLIDWVAVWRPSHRR